MAMNRIFTLLLIILFPLLSQSQQIPTTVKGVVYDTASKRGLAYATISVVNAKDSTLVTFTRADSTGKFKVTALDKGKYLLSSSYVGFIPVWKSLEVLVDGQEINLGNVDMTDILNSGDVTVTARRPPVTISGDTVEFNAENFKTQPNAVVEDMLKKLPGVTVDNDGTVRVNGQRINRVLVNGKEFFTGDPKMATKNLDADAIDKVQVFDKKSDRAEFTGVDDGQSEKTINLKLKKDRNRSVFGKVTAAAGTEGRLDAQTNINKFNGDQQISAIGMGNNTNRQGFSISDVLNFTGELSRGMRSGGGGVTIRMGGGDDNGLPVTGAGQNQQGVATTYAGGINFNDTWNKKTDFNASGMGSNIDLRTNRATNRHSFFTGNEFDYMENSSTARNSKQQRVNMMIDSKIDSFNSFKFTPAFTTQQVDSRSTSNYSTTDVKGIKRNEGLRNNKTHSEAFNFGGNALYRKRFQKKGRTISSNVSLTYNDSKQDGDVYNLIKFYAAGVPLPDSIVNQKNRREATTRSFGANVVYTEPIGKTSLLEISGFYNTNVGNSKRITYDYGATSGKYDQLNLTQSNDFKSDYSYTGGSLSLRSNQKKINFTVGGSLQEAKLNSINNTTGNSIKQSFTDVLPNASLQFKIASSRTLSMSYNTSTTQPSTVQLQPVTDVSDPLNAYTGNPNLKRSYAQSLSLNYISTNMYTQKNFFAFISATKTDNAIVNADVYKSNTSRESTPVNTNGNYMVFGSINAGFPLKKLKSRIDLGVGSNLIHNVSFVDNQQNLIDNMSISPNMVYNFSLENKVDINATARLNISKVRYSLQSQLNSNYLQQVYGLDMTNYLPWGLVINNNFNYTINSGRADGFNTTVGYWNASIAKSFLKNKRAEIKLSAFDLLNQNQGISRNSNQNFVEDTRYNVLQQYFQLGFTFSLNKSGNASSGPRIVTRTIGG
jgi:hypothetical protein